MPSGHEVQPQKWSSDVLTLFDNGDFSVIYGRYENNEKKCLGIRWNGDDSGNAGYPKAFGKPVWFVMPEMLTLAVLFGLRPSQREYRENVEKLLGELAGY